MSYRSEKSGVKVDELLDKIDALRNATQSTDGLLSKEDKKKVDELADSPASNITEADINKWNNKQDTINDLAAIREGAALGATAIQEHQDISGKADKTAVDAALDTKADKSTTYTKEEVDDLIDGVDVSEQLENYYTKDETDTALAGKQDSISDLSTIRSGAAAGATAVQPAALTPIQNAINTIEAVIPSAASAQNQLADKNYVDGSVASGTANFVGTFNSLAELQAVQNPTNNDYGFVIEKDALGNEYYDRYKYNASTQQWLFEYKVESTPFTADQWAAIQSGITSGLVTKLDALPTAQELNTALAGKQAAIDDLADIRSGAALGATALQSFTETDPTVPSWAKANTKPSYTASEVGALPSDTPLFSGDYNDLDNKPAIPTKVSDLTNDSGFTSNAGTITGITMNGASKGTNGVVNLGTVITEHQDISGKADKTAVDAALATKADASSVYTKTETDTMLEGMVICTDDDGSASTASFDAQADTVWNKAQALSSAQQAQARSNISAQEALVSGTNVKTINNESILGSGNITISGGGGGGGASAINDLTDVTISSPSNGQALLYNSTTSKWVNGTVSGGGSISVNDFYYAAWTATSSAAIDVRLTNTLVLPEGVYIFRGQYPACNKSLLSTLDMVNVNNSSTIVSGGSNYGYFTGANYTQMIDILFVGAGGGEVFLKSAQSGSVTYTYLERGYLAAIKIG